jgi:5S rRNA maturation endonuclease (ribonuclease M5)
MELSKFVDEELYPALFLDLDKVFPTMKFEKPSGSTKWRSPFNMDGTSPKHPRKDKTVVTETHYQIVTENGGGGSKNIISYYMEYSSIGDRIEAIRKLSSTLGLIFPEGENAKKWEEIQKQREQLALSFDRQRRALFDSSNPRAVEVLQYLREKRGYKNDQLIRDMGIGYISPEEAKFLKEECNLNIKWNVTDFPLSIAYFTRGHVIGFKCRYITAEAEAKYGLQKYRNALPEWVDMNKNPFGILPNNLSHINKKEQVIVMEGELDALHATALGLPNVIATSGNKIVPEQAEAIRKNGYRNVVILLDADESGQQFTGESIRAIDEAGLNSLTATIPSAKDTDEYLRSHTVEELRGIIDNATFGGLWLYKKEKEKFLQKPTEGEFFKFLGVYIDLASKYREPYKREILFTYLRSDFPGNIEAIEKGIRESVEKRLKATEGEEEPGTALESLKEASATVIEGKGKGESLEPHRHLPRRSRYCYL